MGQSSSHCTLPKGKVLVLLLALLLLPTAAFDVRRHQDLSSLTAAQLRKLKKDTVAAAEEIDGMAAKAAAVPRAAGATADVVDRMRAALWGMHIGE